jgi:hypothetical protein
VKFAKFKINVTNVNLAMALTVPEVVAYALQTVKIAMKKDAINVKIAMALTALEFVVNAIHPVVSAISKIAPPAIGGMA